MNSSMTEVEMLNSIIENIKTEWSGKFKGKTDEEITKVVNDYLTYNDYKNMSEGEWDEHYLLESIYEIEKILEEKILEEKILEEKKINKHKSIALIATFNKTIPQYLIELLNEAKNDLEEINK